MQTDITLWVLSDGRAGNETQALGVAEALARRRSAAVAVRRVALASWAAMVPPLLSWRLCGIAGWPFSGVAEGADRLVPPWPAAVIAAGRRVAPLAAALRRRHAVAAVQILDPQMPARAFDAVIVPQHDALAGANVLRSVGAPNRMTPGAIAEAAARLAARVAALPRPRLAVLVGGPSGSATFTDTDALELAVALETLAQGHGLMVTGSRRTPEGLMARLAASLPGAFVWDGEGENPYPGILGHADAVLVTEDSVNMASEAATTGLPVHVFPLAGVAPKLRRFHESLSAHGASRRFTGAIASWSYEPLAEADRIAGELVRRGVV